MNIALVLRLAGITHVGLIVAGLLMPSTVRLRDHLAPLPVFIRQLFWTYYFFIGLCLVSFGAVSFFFANELASGTALARAVCMFLTVFWSIRLVVAHFVFDLRPYITTGWHRAGLFVANTAFAVLPLTYAWAAIKGGVP
jgi:hypothetical protein